MARKWLQLVSEDGKALTLATSVALDVEDVDNLRRVVKDKYKDSHLAGIAASDLTVFNDSVRGVRCEAGVGRTRFAGHIDESDTLMVQVPQKADSGMSMTQLWDTYFSGSVASSVSFVSSLLASVTSPSSSIPPAKKKV